MPLRRDLEAALRQPRDGVASRDPRCAEPLDVEDVPLLGYDGAPSTQRRVEGRVRHPGPARR